MAKEIAFQISVENAELQQLLKDLGAMLTLYDKLAKSQATLSGASNQLAATQQKILKLERQIVQEQSEAITATLNSATDSAGRFEVSFNSALKGLQNTAMQTATVLNELKQAADLVGLDALAKGMQTINNSVKPTTTDAPDDGTDKVAVAEALRGKAQAASDAFTAMSDALNLADQLSEVRLQNELARIDQKRQAEIDAVNDSVLSEEGKKAQLDSINAKYDKEAEEKKKAAAKREKAFAITKAIIAGAQAVVQGIAQFGPPPSPAGIAAIAAAAVTTAAQVALIAKQKFAKGGYIPFDTGGLVEGAAHSQGGVSFLSGGNLMEAEGGELIVNRNIWSRPDFVKSISEMNAITGGKRFFVSGGMVPTVAPPVYYNTATAPMEGLDSEALVKGLRGVIADEVGSLKIVNNVVDTTSQQQRLLNIQSEASF
jgi:hypothetical protein